MNHEELSEANVNAGIPKLLKLDFARLATRTRVAKILAELMQSRSHCSVQNLAAIFDSKKLYELHKPSSKIIFEVELIPKT